MKIYSVQVSPTTVLTSALLVPCMFGHAISVGAICDAAGATLEFDIVYTDFFGQNVGSLGPTTFQAGTIGSKPNWPIITQTVPAVSAPVAPTLFRAYLQTGDEPVWHPSGVNASIVFLVSSGGDWTVSAFVVFPPGVPNP